MPNWLLLLLSVIFEFSVVVLCSRYFGVAGLTALCAVFTVLANIEVLVLVEAFGMEQTLGNVLFAATFLITDVISELHGKDAAKRCANVCIALNVVFAVVSLSWLLYTPSAGDVNYPAIRSLFSGTPRVVLSSLAVFAVSQRLDVWLYHRLWDKTAARHGRKKKLWLRNNAATLISQLANTVLFNLAAFAGVYELKTLLSIIAAGYAVFVFTSLADTPFLYWARRAALK